MKGMRMFTKALGTRALRRLALALALILCLALGLPGFAAAAETARIGLLLPLSGSLARYGQMASDAFTLALEDIRRSGRLPGLELRLVTQDTAADPKRAADAVRSLVTQQGSILLAGGLSGHATLEAARTADDLGVPFLVTTASADKITEKGWKNVFRLCSPYTDYPDAVGSFLTQAAPVKSVAIIFDNTLGRFGASKFQQLCQRLSIRLLIKESFEGAYPDFQPFAARVAQRRPDLVYFVAAEAQAALMLEALRAADVRPQMIMGRAPWAASPALRSEAGDLAAYVVTADLWAPSVPYPGARRFFDDFRRLYGYAPDYHGAQAYAALQVIADAIQRTAALTPEDLREALNATALDTIYGPVKFVSHGQNHRQNLPPYLVLQWIGPRLETVWPRRLASATPVFPLPPWIVLPTS